MTMEKHDTDESQNDDVELRNPMKQSTIYTVCFHLYKIIKNTN